MMNQFIVRSFCIAGLTAGALSAQYRAVDDSPASNGFRYNLQGGTPAQQVGMFQGIQLGTSAHAMLITGNGSTVVDLHPTSLPPDSPYFTVPNALVNTLSDAFASDGVTQVGRFINTAVLWTGTPESMVNLHPSQYSSSSALAVRGLQQAGWATAPAPNGGRRGVPQSFLTSHAILWQGSANNFVDLHPAGFDGSAATSLSAGSQAGYGITNNNTTQALMWSGTAASVINLHPQPFTSSVANGVSNTMAVGTGTVTKSGKAITSVDHAVLWFGSAKNYVDLNPAGFASSDGLAMNDTKQVGFGMVTDVAGPHYHALVWTGTAASVVDLNQFLPAGYTDARALSIDTAGNIVGSAWGADQVQHPLVWMAQ